MQERLRMLEQKELESRMPKPRARPPARASKIAAMQASLGLADKFCPMMMTPGLPPPLQRDEEGHVVGIGAPADGSGRHKARALGHTMTAVDSPMILVPEVTHAHEGGGELGLSMTIGRAARVVRRPSRKPRADMSCK